MEPVPAATPSTPIRGGPLYQGMSLLRPVEDTQKHSLVAATPRTLLSSCLPVLAQEF